MVILWIDQYTGPPIPDELLARNKGKPSQPPEVKMPADIALPSDLQVLTTGETLTRHDLTLQLNSISGRDGSYLLNSRRERNITIAAMADDNLHHIVHDFLVGYAPFQTDQLWMPWFTLSKKKTYQFDHIQYGREEVWQTSKQAFHYTRGDCEDHALALADWLIEMGYDARVVLGTVEEGAGHAWVVLFLDGQEYLLEATRKNRNRSISRYPLARFETSYHPEYMFNRDGFWMNTGSKLTTSYTENWVRKSEYLRW